MATFTQRTGGKSDPTIENSLAMSILLLLNTKGKTISCHNCGSIRAQPETELPDSLPTHPLYFTEAGSTLILTLLMPSKEVIFHFSPAERGGSPIPLLGCHWPAQWGASLPGPYWWKQSLLHLPTWETQWGLVRSWVSTSTQHHKGERGRGRECQLALPFSPSSPLVLWCQQNPVGGSKLPPLACHNNMVWISPSFPNSWWQKEAAGSWTHTCPLVPLLHQEGCL